jgi:hypothetical protein
MKLRILLLQNNILVTFETSIIRSKTIRIRQIFLSLSLLYKLLSYFSAKSLFNFNSKQNLLRNILKVHFIDLK